MCHHGNKRNQINAKHPLNYLFFRPFGWFFRKLLLILRDFVFYVVEADTKTSQQKQTKTHNVMIKKNSYEAPELEVLEVVTQVNIMSGGTPGEDENYNDIPTDF